MRSGGTDGVIDVTFNDAQMAILAWSPTTIPYNQIEHAPAHRNSQEIFFVGVKERLDPYAVFPFVWRRVVFWTHQRFEQFRTIEGLGGTRFRLGVTYGVSDLSAFDIQELMFKGSAGVDWDTTRPIDARLDTQRIRVVSDRKVNFNPNSEQGRYSLFKRWHPIRRKIIYDQQENGDDMTQIIGRLCLLRVVAICTLWISLGFLRVGSGAAARLSIQSTVYWREWK